ncbi:hypothetical protein BC834DRAFT_892318 [Gloeopeniophorella convolvens]|nr:hypothetical protein BC834DRAFT_892318 [Gloeopeniophorella convolvens]
MRRCRVGWPLFPRDERTVRSGEAAPAAVADSGPRPCSDSCTAQRENRAPAAPTVPVYSFPASRPRESRLKQIARIGPRRTRR